MKAARLHGPGDIRVEEVPAPGAPPAGWVRLKVRAAGICGSDIHNFRTGQWISRLPVTPGHELSGEVAEIGAGVAGFAPGDLVVADSRANCGTCVHCLDGRGNVCLRMGFLGELQDGGFAEELVIAAEKLLRVPAGVAPEIAALSEPLGVALRVVRRLDPMPGTPILIAGGGCIGGFAAFLLAELGFGPIHMIERNAERLALLGSLAGIRPIALDEAAFQAAFGPAGPRFAIEATGSMEVLRRLVGLVSSGGRIAMVGIFHGEGLIDPNQIVEREIELRGCSVFAGEQREVVDLLPRLAPKLRGIVSAPIGLDAVPETYARLVEGRVAALKTLIRP